MPGDTASAAVRAFVAALNQAAACVTHSVIIQGGHDPARGPLVLFFRPGPVVHLGGPHDLSLSFLHHYTVVQLDGPKGPWRVHSTAYNYELLLPNGRQLMAYHWHPRGRSRVTWPHLHLRSVLEPVDLTHAHPPTGRVSFEAVLRMALEELDIPPRRDHAKRWQAILQQTEQDFWRVSTWGAPPTADPSAQSPLV